ncbi:MAG: hypothetical protein AAGL17_16845, partial [Cyanobacteria bacterium J06576_12]
MNEQSTVSDMGDVGNVGDVGEKAGVVTLAVDIGGSGVKALLLNEKGEPLDERDRIKTPKPATPDAVMAVLKELVSRKGHF